MIFLLLLLDILINNYTSFTSYFFLVYLYDKPYKYYLLTGLILDLIIFNTYFYNIVILSIIYLFIKIFKDLNKKNFYIFMFFCTYTYILFIVFSKLITFNNFNNILISIGSNLLINLLFYALSFRVVVAKKSIKC